MLFNSYIFILLFLPICLLGYFGLNHFGKERLSQLFLFAMSMWFYGYFNPAYLFVILLSIAVNYLLYLGIRRNAGRRTAKTLMILGVLANCGILVYYKYMDFFISNVNAIFQTDYNLWHIALPLGISFFTFQQISFVVDAYRGEVQPVDLLKYACFVSYFPQLIAGPIVTHDELIPQLEDPEKKKVNYENLCAGIYMFTLGLAKKALLADVFSDAVIHGFATLDTLKTQAAWLTMIAYMLQLYFDFSGYCDMAIGIARMMNIDLPLNFDEPYKSLNISEFWKRWHATLSRFLTKYVYFPLGGSRKGAVRTLVNLFLVFLISGLWHGSAWTYVVWGAINGAASVIYRIFRKQIDKWHPAFGCLVTNLIFGVSLMFFRADSLAQGWQMIRTLFSWNFGYFDEMFTEIFRTFEIRKVLSILHVETYFPHFIMTAYFLVSFYLIWGGRNAYYKMQHFKPTVGRLFVTLFLLLWSIFSLSGLTVFLYFNF